MVRPRTEEPELVAVRGAGKRFDGRWIFQHADIAVRAGEVVGLLGASGSGKSTILRCMSGFEKLTEGSVWIENKPADASPEAWTNVRRRVGFVQQNLNLWPYRNVVGNIAEGLRHGLGLTHRAATWRAVRWARRLGLHSHLRKFPASLSGGEQQRVAIARAMAMQPRVLLLDEITSNLDPVLAGEVGELIASLRTQGLGMLVVSHQIAFIRTHADWVYFLDGGTVKESGPAHDVLSEPHSPELRTFIERVRKGW